MRDYQKLIADDIERLGASPGEERDTPSAEIYGMDTRVQLITSRVIEAFHEMISDNVRITVEDDSEYQMVLLSVAQALIEKATFSVQLDRSRRLIKGFHDEIKDQSKDQDQAGKTGS